jgi:hypothetical protein
MEYKRLNAPGNLELLWFPELPNYMVFMNIL